jgi:adenylate kinase family enzyme
MADITELLQGLNLSDRKIEIVFIVGPPGSGKSTVAEKVAEQVGVRKVDTDYGWGTVNLMNGAMHERNTISAGECGTGILRGNHLIISCGVWFVQYLKNQIIKFFPDRQFNFTILVPKINDMSHDESWKTLMSDQRIIDRLMTDANRPSTDEYLDIMKGVGKNGLAGLAKVIASCNQVICWNPLAPVSESVEKIVDVFATAQEFALPVDAKAVQSRDVVVIEGIMYHITTGYSKAGTLSVTLDAMNQPFNAKVGYIVDYEVESSTTKAPIKIGTKGSIVVLESGESHITMNPKNGVPPVHSGIISRTAMNDENKLIITINDGQTINICNIAKRTDDKGNVITSTYTPIGRSFSHGDF